MKVFVVLAMLWSGISLGQNYTLPGAPSGCQVEVSSTNAVSLLVPFDAKSFARQAYWTFRDRYSERDLRRGQFTYRRNMGTVASYVLVRAWGNTCGDVRMGIQSGAAQISYIGSYRGIAWQERYYLFGYVSFNGWTMVTNVPVAMMIPTVFSM